MADNTVDTNTQDGTVVETPATPERNELDFFGMYLLGQPSPNLNIDERFANINEMTSEFGATPVLYTPDKIKEVYPELNEMDPEKFNQEYDQITKLFDYYNTKQFHSYKDTFYTAPDTPLTRSSSPEIFVKRENILGMTPFNIKKGQMKRKTDPLGQEDISGFKQTITGQQAAEANKFYKTKEGKLKPLELADIGKYLVLDNDEQYGHIWKEADPHDRILGEMRSIYGPTEMESTFWDSSKRGLFGALVGKTSKGLGWMGEVSNKVNEIQYSLMYPNYDPSLMNKYFDALQGGANRLYNFGNWTQKQNMDEREGVFSNGSAFTHALADGIGQTLQVLLGAVMTGGVGSLGGVLGLGRAGATLTTAEMGKLGQWLTLSIASAQKAAMFKEEMEKLGMDRDEALALSTPFFATCLFVENFVGPNVLSNPLGRSTIDKIRPAITDRLKNEVIQQVSKEGRKRTALSMFKDMNKKIYDLSKSAGGGFVVAGGEEGIEEIIEGGLDAGFEYMLNGVYDMQADNVIKTWDDITFTAQPGKFGKEEYLGTDKYGNQKVYDKGDYEAIQQDLKFARNVKDQGGLFHDIKWFAGDEAVIAFLSAAPMGAMTNFGRRKKEKQRKRTINELAFESIRDPKILKEFDDILNQLYNEGIFGKNWVDENNNVVTAGSNDMSQADVLRNQVKQEFNVAREAMLRYDIASPAVWEAVAGTKDLIAEATEVAEGLIKATNALQAEGITDEQKQVLQNEIASLNEQMDYLINPVEDGKHSQAYADRYNEYGQYDAIMGVKAKQEAERELKDKAAKKGWSDAKYRQQVDKLAKKKKIDLLMDSRNAVKYAIERGAISSELNDNSKFAGTPIGTHNAVMGLYKQSVLQAIQDYNKQREFTSMPADEATKLFDSVEKTISNIDNDLLYKGMMGKLEGDALKGFNTSMRELDSAINSIKQLQNNFRYGDFTGELAERYKNIANNLQAKTQDMFGQVADYLEDPTMFDELTADPVYKWLTETQEGADFTESSQNLGGTEFDLSEGTPSIPLNINEKMTDQEMQNSATEAMKDQQKEVQDKIKYDAMNNMMMNSTVPFTHQGVGTFINEMMKLVDQKIDIDNPSAVHEILDNISNFYDAVETSFAINKDYFQDDLESNKDTREFSPIRNDYMSKWDSNMIGKTLNDISVNRQKIEKIRKETGFERGKHEFMSRVGMANMRYSFLIWLTGVENFKDEIAGFEELSTLLEQLYNTDGKKVNVPQNFDFLYEKFIEHSTDQQKNRVALKDAMTSVERLLFKAEESLVGKLGGILKDYINTTRGVAAISPFADDLALYYSEGKLQGLMAVDDTGIIVDKNTREWYTLTQLERLNTTGENGRVTKLQMLQAIRDVYKDQYQEGKAQVYGITQTIEQEAIVLHMLEKFFYPEVDFSEKYTDSKKDVYFNTYNKGLLGVIGYAGAGKSTVIIENFLRALDKINGKPSKLTVVVPNTRLMEVHKDNLKAMGVDEKRLNFMFLPDLVVGEKQIDPTSDFVIIDEGSLFPLDTKKIKHLNSKIGKQPTYILYDDSQTPDIDKNRKQIRLPVAEMLEKTLPATEVHRTGLPLFFQLQDSFRKMKGNKVVNFDILPKGITQTVNGVKYGLEYSETNEGIISSFKSFMDSNPDASPEDCILIFIDTETRNKMISKYNLGNYADNIMTIQYDYNDIDLCVSGIKSKNVFFAYELSEEDLRDPYSAVLTSRVGLTGVSRATNYINIVAPGMEASKESEIPGIEKHVRGTTHQDMAMTNQENKIRMEEYVERLTVITGNETNYRRKTEDQGATSFNRETPLTDEETFYENNKSDIEKLAKIKRTFDNTPADQDSVNRRVYARAIRYLLNGTEENYTYLLKAVDEKIALDKKNENISPENQIKDAEKYTEALLRAFVTVPSLQGIYGSKLSILDGTLKYKDHEGHPAIMKVVGKDSEGRLIVDLYDFNFAKNIRKMGEGTADRIGRYAALLLANGYVLNNAKVYNIDVDTSDGITIGYDSISHMDEEQMIKSISKGLSEIGFEQDKDTIASQEQLYTEERDVDIEGISVGSYFTDNTSGETHIIENTTKVGNDEFVYVKGEKIPVSEFNNDYQEAKGNPNYNLFEESAIEFSSAIPVTWSSTNAYTLSDTVVVPTSEEDFYDISKNKVLAMKQDIMYKLSPNSRLDKVLLKDQEIVTIRDGKVSREVMPFVVAYVMPESMMKRFFTGNTKHVQKRKKVAAEILGKDASKINRNDFKALGMHIISFDRTADQNFGDGGPVKVSENDTVRYLEATDEQAENVLDNIFEFSFQGDRSQKALIELNKYTMRQLRRGYKDENGVIENNVEIQKIEQGRPINNFKKYTTLEELSEQASKNGFKIQNIDFKGRRSIGGRSRFAVKLYRTSTGDSKVIYFDGRAIKSYNEIDNIIINFNNDYKNLKNRYTNAIKDSKGRMSESDNRQLFEDLIGTEAYQFILFNRSNILKSEKFDGTDFSGTMYIDEGTGRYDIAGLTVLRKLDNMKKALSQIKSAMQADGEITVFANPFVNKNSKSTKKSEKKDGIIRANLESPTKDFSQLALWTKVDNRDIINEGNNNPTFRDEESLSGFDQAAGQTMPGSEENSELFKKASGEIISDPVNVAEALNTLVRILGDKNVFGEESKVFLNEGWLRNSFGEKLYGLMSNSLISLSVVNGQVNRVTARHEAMHFVMWHMLNDRARDSVMNDTRRMMEAEGLDSTNERDVYEYAAEKFEAYQAPKKPKGITGMVSRFFKWLMGAITQWNLHYTTLDDLMYQVDNGHFSNKPMTQMEGITLEKTVDNRYNSVKAASNLRKTFVKDSITEYVKNNRVLPVLMDFSPVSKNVKLENPSWYDAIMRTINHFDQYADNGGYNITIKYRGVAEKDTPGIDESQIGEMVDIEYSVFLNQMTPTDFKHAYSSIDQNGRAINEYIKFNLSDKQVLMTMLQSLFGNIDVENFIYNAENGHQDNGSQGKAMFGGEIQNYDPKESRSRFLDLIFGSIPLYRYSTKKIVNNKYVTPAALDDILTDIVVGLRAEQKWSTKEFFSAIKDRIDVMPQRELKDMLYSFMVHLGSEKISSEISKRGNLSGMGAYLITQDPQSLIDQFPQSLIDEYPQYKNNIKEMVKNLEQVISAVKTYYYSLHNRRFSVGEFNTKGQFTVNVMKSNNDVSTKANMRDNMVSALYNSGDKIVKAVKEQIFGKDAIYTVNANQVLRKGKAILSEDGISISDARELFTYLKLDDVTVGVIKSMDNKEMANNLHTMMLSLRLAAEMESVVDDLQNNNNDVPSYEDVFNGLSEQGKVLAAVAQEKYALYGLSRETMSMHRTKGEESDKSFAYPSPVDNWEYIEKLAKSVRWSSVDGSTRTVHVLKERSFPYTPSSHLFDKIGEGSEVYAGKVIEDIMLRHSIRSQEKINTPLARKNENGDIVFNNPILNNKLGVGALNVFSGFETMVKTSKIRQSSPADIFKLIFEGMIYDNISNTYINPKVQMMFDTQADKSTKPWGDFYAVGDTKRNKKFADVVKGKGKLKDIKVNTDLLIDVFNDFVDYYKNVRQYSLDRWSQEAGVEFKTVEDLNKWLSSNQVKAMDSIFGLTMFKDYNVEDGVISAGNAVTLEGIPYQQLVDEWDNTDNKYGLMKAAYQTQFDMLVEQMKEEGYQLPNEVAEVMGEFMIEGKDSMSLRELTRERDGKINELKKTSKKDKNIDFKAEARKIYKEYDPKIKKANKAIKEGNYKQGDTWHPFIETAFWIFNMYNESVSQITRGSQLQYADITDYVKRAAGNVAPGTNFDLDNRFGIGENSRVLVMDDIMMKNQYANNKKVNATDGLSNVNPVMFNRMKKSTGGKQGVVSDGAIKTVVYDYDPVTDNITYFKMSQMPITETMFRNGKLYQDMLRTMLGENIWEQYGERLINPQRDNDGYILDKDKYDNVINEIAEAQDEEGNLLYTDEMIDYVVHKSAFKSGVRNIANYSNKNIDNISIDRNLNNFGTTITVPNKGLRVQQITTQDVYDTHKVLPTQILYIIGLMEHNNGVIEDVNDALATFVNMKLNRLEDMNEQQRHKYIQSIGLKNAARLSDNGKKARIFKTRGISHDVVRKPAIRDIISDVNKNIKPTLPGQSYIQNPALTAVVEDAQGNVFLPSEVGMINDQDLKNVPKGMMLRQLQPMHYLHKKDGKTVEVGSKEELIAIRRQAIKEGKDPNDVIVMKPAEVLMPYSYMKAFGVSPRMTMTDLMTITSEDKVINFNNKTEKQIFDLIEGIQKNTSILDPISILSYFHEDIRSELMNRILTSYKDQNRKGLLKHVQDLSKQTETKKRYVAPEGGKKKMKEVTEAVIIPEEYEQEFHNQAVENASKDAKHIRMVLGKYFSNLNKTFDVFIDRIPTSNASLGSMGRIVGFVNDASNTVFISPLKNTWDGSDYDIDALNIFFRAIDDYGNIANEANVVKYNQNQLFNAIEQYYNNSMNIEFIYAEVGLDQLRDSEYNTVTEGQISNDIATTMNLDAVNWLGTNMVGHFANMQNYISKLMHLPINDRMKHINSELKLFYNDFGVPEVIDFMSNLINAATDNAKEGGIIGKLNMNEAMSPIIAGMLMHGVGISEVKKKDESGDEYTEAKFDPDVIIDFINTDEMKRYANMTRTSIQAPKKAILDVLPTDSEAYKYAIAGEQLRRFGEIASIQQELKNDDYEFNRTKNNIELSMGMGVNTFDKTNFVLKDHSVQKQIEYITDNHYKYLTSNELASKLQQEEDLRKMFNIPMIVSNMSNLKSYIRAISVVDKFIEDSFSQDNNKAVKENIYSLTKQYSLPYKNAHNAMTRGIERAYVSNFITDTFRDTYNLTFDNMSSLYNMDQMDDRVQFTLDFADYVRNLKKDENLKGNMFLKRLTIETLDMMYHEYIKFNNSIYLSDAQKMDYYTSFMQLPESVKKNFRMYQLIRFGFNYQNGSFTDVIDEVNEHMYSRWIATGHEKMIDNAASIAREIIVKENQIAQTAKFNKNGDVKNAYGLDLAQADFLSTTFLRGGMANMVELIDGEYQIVNDKYLYYVNTYDANNDTQKRTYTNNKKGPILKRDDLRRFMETEKDGTITITTTDFNKVKIRSKESDDPKTAARFPNTLVNNDEVVLPNGEISQIERINTTSYKLKKLSDNVWDSDITIDNARIGKPVADVLIEKVRKLFPRIKVRIVSNETAKRDSLSYILDDGVVYLNMDKIQYDTPIHEFTHILIDILQHQNRPLYDRLASIAEEMILNNNPSIQIIKDSKMYRSLGKEAFLKEVMANITGWHSIGKVENLLKTNSVKNHKSTASRIWNGIRKPVQEFWTSVKNYIKGIFSGDINADIIDRLNTPELTFKDLADAIVSAVENGQALSYITSKRYADIYMGNSSWDSAIEGDISSFKGLANSFVNPYNKRVLSDLTVDQKIQHFKDLAMRNGGVLPATYIGEEVKASKIDRNTIDKIDNKSKNLKKNIEKLFNDKDGSSAESIEVFGKNKFDNPIYSENTIKRLASQIDYLPNYETAKNLMTVIEYSKLKEIFPELSQMYDERFDQFDPMLTVMKVGEKYHIGVFDISTTRFGDKPGGTQTENILIRHMNDDVAKIRKITLQNNNGDVRKLFLGFIMAKMANNTDVVVTNGGVISMSAGEEGTSSFKPVDVINMNNNISAMSNNKKFMDSMSEDMRIVFTNTLKVPQVDHQQFLLDMYNSLDIIDNGVVNLRHDENLSIEDRKNIFSARVNMLKEKAANGSLTRYEQAENEHLMEALANWENINRIHEQMNSYSDVTTVDKLIKSGFDVGNEYVQKARSIAQLSARRVVNRINNLKGEMDPIFQWFIDKYGSGTIYAADISDQLFQDLWVKTKVKDDKGNEHLVNTGFIYWTKDENKGGEFARMAKENNVSDEIIKHGEWFVNMVEDYLVDMLYHKRMIKGYVNKGIKNKKGIKYTKEDARKELFNETNYVRGMMPVMGKTTSALFAQGKLGKAWKKKKAEIQDVYAILDEAAEMKSDKRGDELSDKFFWQFGHKEKTENKTELGSTGRLSSLLGIEQTFNEQGKAEFILVDKEINDNMSMDMETLMNYFAISMDRKIEYESHVLPMMNGLRVFLEDLKHSNDIATSGTIDYLRLFEQRAIRGEKEEVSGDLIPGVNIQPTVELMSSMGGTVILFGNVNIGVTSSLINGMNAFIEGIANTMVDRGLYNVKDLVQASTLFFREYNKVTQLANQMQVFNMSEYELVSHQYRQKTKKYLTGEYMGHWTNWASDMYARCVVMTAQMLHDGSYNAYTYNKETGKVDYDETKDKRFTDDDAGTALKNHIRERLILDGMQNPDEEKLAMGYDLKEGMKFKILADKYIIGAYDHMTKSNMANFLVGRMFNMFKQYLSSKIDNAIQKGEYIEDLGWWKVKEVDGQMVAHWERVFVEGYMRTMLRMTNETMKTRSVANWANMETHEKYNMAKMAVMVGMFLTTYLVYNGLVNEDDDDEYGLISDYRFVRNLKYAYSSIFAMPEMFKAFDAPFAIVGFLKRAFFGHFGDIQLKNMLHLLPLYSSYETVAEPFDNN